MGSPSISGAKTGLFITGTDTGVGKTVVACALVTELVRRGLSIAVRKPAETGWGPSSEATSDAARLHRAAGSTEPLAAICPYRFREPLAPAVAARLEGVSIDMEQLVRLCGERRASSDLLIVEGAGGLLVPLVDRSTYVDLARELGLSVLVVAPNRLGVINHTALTARVAAADGLRVIGFVLNNTCDTQSGADGYPAPLADASTPTNRSAIEELTGLTCFGEIPYEPSAADEPDRISAYLDVSGILAAVTGKSLG